jgi:aspartate carbamoyltransferase catalytic subunit
MRSFIGRDILSLKEWERAEYQRLYEVADELAPIAKNRRNTDLLAKKTLVAAFYQPSTRTRLSTEAAMCRLGGKVCGFADFKMTRAGDFYQESIKDVVHMLEYYGDVIAMRHFQQGAPQEAARWASVPIINCGDGWGEHPTQILTDFYTILKERGTLDGLHWLCIGDMRMRTMHTIGYALSQFNSEVTFVHPADMAFQESYLKDFDQINLKYRFAPHVADVIHEADIIYLEPVIQADYTKARQETDGEKKKGGTPANYQVTRKLLKEKAKHDAIVLHSLPRMDELTEDVDATRHARYWPEAFYGVVVRMALLASVLGVTE